MGWSAGQVQVRSVWVWGGYGQNFSNSCGCGAGLNFTVENKISIHEISQNFKVVNVYKSYSRLTPMTIPTFPHTSLYDADFNCQHLNWGYNTTSLDNVNLDSWATSNNLDCCTTQRKRPVSSLVVGTSAPIQT